MTQDQARTMVDTLRSATGKRWHVYSRGTVYSARLYHMGAGWTHDGPFIEITEDGTYQYAGDEECKRVDPSIVIDFGFSEA